MKYFVMLHGHTDGVPRPICRDSEDDDRIRLFDSEEDADTAGRLSPLGSHYGFEVYAWKAQVTRSVRRADHEDRERAFAALAGEPLYERLLSSDIRRAREQQPEHLRNRFCRLCGPFMMASCPAAPAHDLRPEKEAPNG